MRLSAGKSILKDKKRTISSLGWLISLFLFHVPLKRLEALNESFADEIVRKVIFKSFVTEIVSSWQVEIVIVSFPLSKASSIPHP